MKKVLMIMTLLLFISGCEVENKKAVVKDTVNSIIESNFSYPNNHIKELFSYYLPKDVGVFDSNQISSVLLIDNIRVFMGINVSEIISEKSSFEVDVDKYELVYEYKLKNFKNKELDQTIVVEKLSEKEYLLYLKSDNTYFMTILKEAEIPSVLEKMLLISKSIDIDKKLVVKEFSNKETINYKQEVIELFSESVPKDGFIRDFIESEEGDGN